MLIIKLRFYLIVLLGNFMVGSSLVAAEALSLRALWQESRSSHYQVPSYSELQQAQALFIQHFNGEWSADTNKKWQQLGFSVVEQAQWLVIQEQPSRREGRGLFVFNTEKIVNNTNKKPQPILQAPHSFKDLYTGRIAFKLFAMKTYQAAAWNTVPRDKSDMAHLNESCFNAFTAAYSQVVQGGRIVQLHGFSQQKRSTVTGGRAQLIISPAKKRNSAEIRNITRCLQDIPLDNVYSYPQQVTELGGTTNSNAQRMREYAEDDFVHVEMSKPFRQRLLKNRQLRENLNNCLVKGAM